jgi:hypothetical protein
VSSQDETLRIYRIWLAPGSISVVLWMFCPVSGLSCRRPVQFSQRSFWGVSNTQIPLFRRSRVVDHPWGAYSLQEVPLRPLSVLGRMFSRWDLACSLTKRSRCYVLDSCACYVSGWDVALTIALQAGKRGKSQKPLLPLKMPMPPSSPSSIGSPISEARLRLSPDGRHIKPLPQRSPPKRKRTLDTGDEAPSLTHSAGSQSVDETDLPTPAEYDLFLPVFPPPNSVESLVKAVAAQTKLFGGTVVLQDNHELDDAASDEAVNRDEVLEPEIRFIADEIGRTNKKKRKVPGAVGSSGFFDDSLKMAVKNGVVPYPDSRDHAAAPTDKDRGGMRTNEMVPGGKGVF